MRTLFAAITGFFAGHRVLLFAALLLAQFAVFYSESFGSLVTRPYLRGLARASAPACGWVAGTDRIRVEGQTIFAPDRAVDLLHGCDGLPAVIVFFAATLAYPCGWRAKLGGLLFGFAAIQILNVVRVVSLFWFIGMKPDLFELVHVGFWQGLMVLFVLGLWSFWESRWAAASRTP